MSIGEWIDAKNIGKYAAQIADIAGDMSDLLEITDDDVQELIAECATPKLAVSRFRKALIELGAQISAS